MSILLQFSVVALKGFGGEAASDAMNVLVGVLRQRFADNSKRLTAALERSAANAWRATEVALAGAGWWDRCKLILASADQRAFREQVQAFLTAHPLDGVDGHGPDFRAQCLAQLQAARKAGLLDRGRLDPDELAHHVGDLSRFGDGAAVLDAEFRRLAAVADVLRQHGYEALAAFVELRPASGPPLLLSAMRYFFRRAVERDEELARGLAHDQMQKLAEGQQAGFTELALALDQHGDRLEVMLGDVLSVVTQTRADVLDVKAELERQGQQTRELANAVLEALRQHQLDRRELRGQDSLSIRDENERRLVKDLVKRYRSLPAEQRKTMPALLNAMGKLQVVAGDYESAEQDFREVTKIAGDPRARAEAAHNLYRAALERRAWAEALTSFVEAVTLDAERFASFPMNKYEPVRILGAGGFGVAFLCRNRHSGAQVVIKTLRREGLDRDMNEIFREAQALEALEHPAIIRVRDCDYADAASVRPYLVMDYFEGQNLADFVEQNGPLPTQKLLPLARIVAEGLHKAHGKGILHRDVKPANLLVRRNGSASGWDAKLIDFGLALRADAVGSTRKASLDRTLLGSSIAGTLDYAAPEQMNKLQGVAVGTYSDVYGFAKTCCFALFGTTQPTYQHWQTIPRDLADLLGRCLSEQPKGRPQDFAAVLAELDRLMKPREVPVPKVAPVVLDAVPVEEPPRREPRRELARRDEPRRSRVEELREVPLPAQGSILRTLRPLLLGLIVIGGGLGAVWFFRWIERPSAPPRPAFVEVIDNPKDGWPKDNRPPLVKEPSYLPFEEKDFRDEAGIIETLRDSPSQERRKTIAGRLAATDPTDAQKKRHAEYRRMKGLWEIGSCPKEKWQNAQDEDDVLLVSRGLAKMKPGDLQAQKNLVGALQKWGTEENLEQLIALTETGHFGSWVVRVSACKALTLFSDQKGANAVAARFVSGFQPEEQGVKEALLAYPSKQMAETALLSCIEGKGTWHVEWPSGERKEVKYDDRARRLALDVLAEIGSRTSIGQLEKLAGDPRCGAAARKAVETIEKRHPKQ